MPRPLVLFGAFDRHNFGDLLFPHLAAALLPGRELVYAGLAARDLRAYGGHAVRALPEVLAAAPAQGLDLLHVGGEILTTSAWQAAVMLQPATEAPAIVAYLQARPDEQAEWVRRTLSTDAPAPYLLDRRRWPALRRVAVHAAGGVALAACTPELRAGVQAGLRAADAVSVRDAHTLTALQAAGIIATLQPDAAVLVPALFGTRLQAQAAQGEVAALRARFARGYLAVQCSADFGDDATLQALTQQLQRVANETDLGLVLFRAGAAPWHDSLLVLQRLALRLPAAQVQLFGSLDLWDIAALVAASAGVAGSSLHGRIVATACALPAVSLRTPVQDAQQGKTAAWVQTWEDGAPGSVVDVADLAAALHAARAVPASVRRQRADALAARARQGWDALRAVLD